MRFQRALRSDPYCDSMKAAITYSYTIYEAS